MAKKPETVDRFRVTCEVAKEQLGHIIAEFTKLGLSHVTHELITETINFKGSQVHAVKAHDFLRAWIAEHATFNRADAVKHFEEHGRTGAAASTALYRLREDGDIKSIGAGNYQRSGVRAIAPPKPAPAKEAPALNKKGKPILRRPNMVARYATSNIDFLLSKIRHRQKFTVKEITELFLANGRIPKSVSPVLGKLVATHKIKHVAPGEYAVIHKPAKPNGAAQSETSAEVSTNGN